MIKIKSMMPSFSALLAFMALTCLSTQSFAGDGFRLGLFGGLHGGSLTRYTKATPTDPIKGGTIGINYGAQAGVDVFLGPIWLAPMYNLSFTWATDYVTDINNPRDVRYDNPQLVLPLLFNFRKNNIDAGIGAFYAHPLADTAHRDSGLALGARFPVHPKIFGGVLILGGFRNTPEQGSPIQISANLGFNLK